MLVTLVLLAALASTVYLFARSVGAALDVRRSRGPDAGASLLSSAAALTGAAAAGVYAWGMLGAVAATLDAADTGGGPAPLRVCPTETAESLAEHGVEFLPLRYVCETEDGATYVTDDVPGYVTPVALSFATASVVLTFAARRIRGSRDARGARDLRDLWADVDTAHGSGGDGPTPPEPPPAGPRSP
ncbi:hypothetical protein ABZ714_01580 [Streptomyces sp. NPDC006798]|uniref:hypothetical protein n=1 Tax=Streptomyces sp. NPDC006798 TaxID=3155462 RepID=UPI0033DEDAE8